jgi:hypothetical protein
MGFLDKILGRKPKVEQPIVQPIELPTETPKPKSKLTLEKKIGLNLEKMNLNLNETVFVLDVSGSMGDRIYGKEKIDSLRDIMEKYQDAKMICFSTNVKSINKASDIPDPSGSTDLAEALIYVGRNISPEPKKIVLISDGQPDSKPKALLIAKELEIPIDIIFIGTSGTYSEKFMEELANATGGKHFVV